MRKWQTILLGTAVVSISGHAAVLVSEDFETYSPGQQPTATRVVADAFTATGSNFITTASSVTNTAGTDIGVHIQDNTASSTALEWEYGTTQSVVQVSFDFSQVSFIADANDAIRFGIGQAGATLGSGSRRYAEAGVYDDGNVRVFFNGVSVTVDTVSPGESHNITLFANDSNTNSGGYTGPDGNDYFLETNSIAWWYDGALVLNGGLGYGSLDVSEATAGGTVGTTEGNLNRVGFVTSSTGDINLDYVFDNIEVSSFVLAPPPPPPEYIIEDDFESDTPGEKPNKPVEVRPSTPNGAIGSSLVVSAATNAIGTGQGLRLIDNSTASSDSVRIEYQFAADAASQLSAARADFVFQPASINTNASSSEILKVAFGDYAQSLTSSSRRFTELRLYPNGNIRFEGNGGNDNQITGGITTNTSYAISIFVNNHPSQSISYTTPTDATATLGPNTVAYYMDDVLVHQALMFIDLLTPNGDGVDVGSTTNGLGRFGFVTDSGTTDVDFFIDDVRIYSIEPEVEIPVPEYLLEIDFENGTPGNAPADASQYRPNPAGTNVYVQIVDSGVNVAGSGNGLQIFDNAPAIDDPDITNLEYNFVASSNEHVSALRVDFAFSALDSSGPGDDYIAVGLGEYNSGRTFQTTANRYIDVRLFDDGTIDFETADTNINGVADIPLLPGANTLTVFANDYDSQSVDYTGPDNFIYSLPANAAAYWLNGSLVLMSNDMPYLELDVGDLTDSGLGTVGTTEDNFGKFGFNTGTSDINLNYVIDDIKITTNILSIVQSYSDWIELYPGLGSDTNLTDDAESDGLDNLTEMALGGDPTVDDAASVLPVISIVEEGGSNWFNYVYMRRVFRADIGLSYDVFSSTDLLFDPLDNATEEAGFEQVSYEWESVTNRVSIDAADTQFMNLEIELAD